VYGFCGRRARQNLFYNADGRIVYHAAAVGVVYDKSRHEQLFFSGHDDDITALDLHPDKVKVVTGQVGKTPKIFVWSSRPDRSGQLQQLCVISGDHKRSIIGLSFSSNGAYIASMGYDNNRSIAIYKWGTNKSLAQMRVGMDKGHNDDVFALDYNPVTDHAVAVGKKFIRFFGVKEGVEERNSDSRDAKLSSHESTIWAKKGVFGRQSGQDLQQNMMCIAFDDKGITYAGSADGHIYRFAEQTMDLAVKAHGAAKELAKVTALWFHPGRKLLISSGDDGFIHLWDPQGWSRGSSPAPVKSFDLNKWVSKEYLRGMPVKLEGMGEAPKDEDKVKLGSPAAAHSLYGDEEGHLLVGTVCNEIYEIDLGQDEPPMCYMQGHYNELWGLSAHPSRQEFATVSEDMTLRTWDMATRTMKNMARLDGPGRSCTYSPDGRYIAVGIGTGGKAKGRPNPNEGKWLLYDAEELSLLFEPPQKRSERIADLKFSPDGRFIAVGSADNFVDVYMGIEGGVFEHRAELKGHSSYVRKVDWSADSRSLQSCCGAYELLYWRLWQDKGDGSNEEVLRPRQEKSSSRMKDEPWATHSCLFGWPVRGIWPEDSDGTDINAIARSHGATAAEGLLATADDFGLVKLFRWPCIVPRAQCKEYSGHSAHVTNVAFTAADQALLSAGGDDRCVFQWQVTRGGR